MGEKRKLYVNRDPGYADIYGFEDGPGSAGVNILNSSTDDVKLWLEVESKGDDRAAIWLTPAEARTVADELTRVADYIEAQEQAAEGGGEGDGG